MSSEEQRGGTAAAPRGELAGYARVGRSIVPEDIPEGNLPGWMRPVISACAEASTHAPEYATIGDALREMEEEARTSQDGARRYQETVNKLMKHNRDVLERMFKEYREDPTAEQIARMEEEVKRAQDEQNARVGRGRSIVPEETERGLADFNAEEQREAEAQAAEEAEAQEEEAEARKDIQELPGNEGMSEEEVTKERARSFAEAQEDRTAQEPGAVEDTEGIFAGGKYTLVQAEGYGDVKAGMVPVGRISLGTEGTPRGANYEGMRIGSDAHYRPNHEPIYLWQRGSGELVVIDGHNRLLRAKLAGAESINAYVFTETEERNEQWARAKYYEKNVREHKASVKEVAWFVSGANIHGRQLTAEELAEYGLNEEQSNKVRIGIMLGRYGAPEVLDALFDRPGEYEFEEDVLGRGGISLADAVRIVEYAKGDRDVQLEGLRALRGEADENGVYGQGRNIEAARRVMQLFLESKGRMSEVGEVEAERERHFLRWLADYQGRKLKELAGDRELLEAQGATKELMEKYGMGGKRKGRDVEKALKKLRNEIGMWRMLSANDWESDRLKEVREAYEKEFGGEEDVKQRYVEDALATMQSYKRTLTKTPSQIKTMAEEKIKEYHGASNKMKYAGARAEVHEWLNELRAKYARKTAAWREAYRAMHEEKDWEKRGEAQRKVIELGKPFLEEARERGYVWEWNDGGRGESKQMGEARVGAYLAGAVLGERRLQFEAQLWDLAQYKGKKPALKKRKYDDAFFAKWTAEGIEEGMKMLKNPDAYERERLDNEYRKSRRAFFETYSNEKVQELRMEEARLLKEGMEEKRGEEREKADAEEALRQRQEMWQHPTEHDELRDEVQRAYGEETGEQMWLNDGVNEAGERVRNVHFSTEDQKADDGLLGKAWEDAREGKETERPNLRRCYARNKAGARLGRDVLIRTPQGNLNWFEFPKDEHTQEVLKKKGIKDLPIRLKVGKHEAEHRGYGWMHVLNHYEDMQAAGESPLLFLYNTLTNLARMEGRGGARYVLGAQKDYNEGRVLVVDLMEDDGCYSIVTCYPVSAPNQYAGSGLLVGRALFRLSDSNSQNRMESRHRTNEVATGTEGTIGKAKAEGNLTQEAPSVNIYDVEVVNEKKQLVYSQPHEPRAHFSVDEAKKRGMMKDGVMEVGNGVLVDRRTEYGVRGAQQASPHLFREPDLDKVGSGEGTQSQGWGLYWSTRWSANAFYHRQFSTAGEPIAPGSREERLMRLLGEALDVEEVDERVLYDLGGAMESFGPSAMRDELYGALESKGASEEDLEFFFEAFENMTIQRSETDEGGLWVDVESRVGGEDMFVRINPDGKFAVNYLADLDVDDGNVLHYDEDAGRLFDEHPGLLEAYRKEGGEYTGKEKGRDVYWGLARALGSDKAASQWLDAHGIRGNKYEDGMSRGKKDGEKMYNYVIFNEDYIKITHINNRHPWSEYSEGNADWERVEDVFNEDGTVRAHFSLGGERAATYGEMEAAGLAYYDPADGKRKFALPTAGVQLRGGFTPGDLNVGKGGHKDVSLAALLHYPELFRAYPELGKMRVRLYRDEKSRVGGYFAPGGILPKEGSYIAVNVGRGTEAGRILNTLLHESQHAIQFHEGWAMGAGSMSQGQALEFLEKAIEQRRKLGTKTAWGKANMKFLQEMARHVREADEKALPVWLREVYMMSHGEQEARYAGERRTDVNGEGLPRVSGVAEGYDTIAVLPEHITELGGITFGNAGVYARLMESRLAPVGDFQTDRRLYQIRESAVRYARLLNGFTREKDKSGESLLLEAQGVAERAVSLLPNEYRAGLEPYRVWLSVFAKLSSGGVQNAAEAARMVPMKRWQEIMAQSFIKQMRDVFAGRVNESDMEFWLGREKSRRVYEEARGMYERAHEQAAAEMGGAAEKALRERAEEILLNTAGFRELRDEVLGEMGKVKTERVLAKLLERVKHQLDAYRKDKTLGAMRKAVAAAYPVPGKNGKPVKGKMNADAYRALEDYMALLELTEGEQAMFERERYTGEGKEKAWADLEEGDLVTVDVWNEDGEKRVITCTKMEYETYACYERMTPEQAEAAARALGEFITTGRQAWENKQEVQKRQVMEWCRDILDEFDTSENARRAESVRNEGVLPGRRWFLNLTSWTMNPAQIFDVLAHVPGLQTFARHVGSRIERAEVQLQQWDKERLYRTAEIMRDVCGVKSKKELRQFIDDMNLTRESGIELIEQAPDFLRQESEVLRRQFLGLLHRKMRQKNFNANTFAAAFEELVKDELMPDFIAEEAQAKYGAVGDAKKSRLHGVDAVFSLLTEDELNKFYDLRKETVKRAKKAEEKWIKEKEEKKAKLEESGGKMRQSHGGEMLQLTKGEAAYRVLLAEQPAYTEMLRQQGYTEEVVQQLREFAGEKVMNLAYALRDELAKRTPEMKALYEKVYGMPFPEEENYFRAFFDVGQETEQRTLGERAEGKASGGGKIYITYTRHQHHSKVDPTMNLLTAYLTVQKQQDVLLAYRDLPQKIQGVLAHQEDGVRMSAALERVVGRGMVTNMRTIAEHMQAAAGEVERVGRDLTNVIDSLGSAAAHAVLNGRVASNMKQFTALFNTLAGSDNVSLWEWEKSKSRVLAGLGVISMREMAARPELASRFKGWEAAGLGEAMFAKADEVTGHGATASETRAGMSFMEKLDVWNNVKSSCILYDAVYRKMKKENPGLTHEELDGAAMEEVRHALAMKSQPQGWRTRSLLATKRSIFSVGNLFLGGESINTFANTARLLAEGRYGRAAAVWFAHGAALQALTFLYNWLTDDEEQWKRRSWKQYAMGVLAGPFMSVPVVGLTIANLGNAVGGGWVPTQNLLPGADLPRMCRQVKSIFGGKKKTSWMDKTIAVNELLRTVAMGALIGKPKSAGHAKVQGVAMATTLVSNLLDFVLRTARAADERL